MDRTNRLSIQPRRRLCSGILALAFVGLLVAGLGGCSHASQRIASLYPGGEWREFTGTWIASGSRNNLRLGGDHQASIARFAGSLVLAGPARPAVGFRADALVFSDTLAGTVGRAAWTDERGNQVFSDLKGPGNGGKLVGTFTGGTGRYAGATGTYEFSWRFLVDNEGTVQGQSSGLKGRIRVESATAASDSGSSQS